MPVYVIQKWKVVIIFLIYLKVSQGLKGALGSTLIYFLNKKLAISSGIWYTGKSVNISYTYPKTIYYKQNTFIFLSPCIYNIYYLQIPVTLKYLTHENAKGFRFYGQAGVTFDFKVSEKPKDPDNNYLYQISQKINQGKSLFNPTNISLYIGFGGEFSINSKNAFFLGINYSQGLFDMLNNMEYQLYTGTPESLNRNLKIKTNSFGLETGIKF